MKFQPKTQKELDEEKVLPEGVYPFEISQANDHVSQNTGNESIKLLIRVFKEDGSFELVNDYLSGGMMYKLLHCCEACGLQNKFASGELNPDDFIGKTGELKLKIDPASGDWSAKNSVRDYVVPQATKSPSDTAPYKAPKQAEKTADVASDEIPF